MYPETAGASRSGGETGCGFESWGGKRGALWPSAAELNPMDASMAALFVKVFLPASFGMRVIAILHDRFGQG
jgi:hypothetical protein